MYSAREAFDAMRLFLVRYERHAAALVVTDDASVDPTVWRDWLDCVKTATQSTVIIMPTEESGGGVVAEAAFVAEEYAGSLPPPCPVCKSDLDAPHPACRDTVTRWMKLLR